MRLRERTVRGRLNYIGPMTNRPRYYADDCSRDVLTLDPRTMEVEDARFRAQPHSLGQAGFALLPHKSAVSDFYNPAEVTRVYRLETERLILEPPQDFPLAVCDSRSVSASDLVEADAMMDIPGKPESSYEGLVVRYNPRHRWSYFSNINRDEVLVFKTHDSDAGQLNHVPHATFSDPSCPPGAAPRASIEMRGIAYWFGR